ncbi:MAG: hypothetical protein C0402_02035 [Thermodesulfovibrio sp.]|nr:hypothetical protein [Thermodesulfovibrio sp.]
MKRGTAGVIIFLLFISFQLADAADEIPMAQSRPGEQRSDLDQGIRLNQMNSTDADRYLKRALSVEPSDPRTNLELGIFYFNRQIFAEAADYFESTKELAPGSAYARQAGEYLEKMQDSGARHQKRWSLSVAAGEQYDSNVTISGSNSPLPEGISRKSDWKNLFYLNGRVVLLRTEKAEASAGYSFFKTVHYKLHDFNIAQNLADITYSCNLNPAVRVGGTYRFEYILVGGSDYDMAHAIAPSVTIAEGRGFSTELQFHYKYTRFKDGALFIGNRERSGQNLLAGVVQTVPVSDAVRIEIGYGYDKDLAEKDYWRYDGNKGFASLHVTLPVRFFLSLYGEYYAKKYEGISPASGQARKDKTATMAASVTRFFTDAFGVSLSETYINNRSNIDDFDYKRYLTTILLHVRF